MTLNLSKPYPKQIEFFKAQSKYIAYGGARGGGKSWAARTKAVLLAVNYSGLQTLLLRRTLPELRENHVIPLTQLLYGVADYKAQDKVFTFSNGSRIVLGYCATESDILQYQGQSYDCIFLEEATQFTEYQYQALTECNRSSGVCKEPFTPRMYLTCNPGGVGHGWVKRLFIDKDYRNSERAEDYTFIKSLVYDNDFLMQNSPDYVRTLENLPEDRKKAMLYGDWDIFDGQYFPEFNRDIHTCEPFVLDGIYKRYRVLDYGRDMLACLWIAVDTRGNAFVYKELHQSGLIISDACNLVKETTGNDNIYLTLAPTDLWNSRQETGKSATDIFRENGIILVKSANNRVHGWLCVKEWLKPYDDEQGTTSKLKIFYNCINLIKNLPALQYDDKDPNDVSDTPHEITHITDALRYFCIYRTRAPDVIRPHQRDLYDEFNIPRSQPIGREEIRII